MAEKAKPLAMENTANGGGDNYPTPTEIDPLEDHVSTKGVAFEGLDTFLLNKTGRAIVEHFPTLFQEVTYSGDNPTAISFYNSASFIVANRVARYDFTYSGDNLTVEDLKVYDTDGSTILKTYTWTHSYTVDTYNSSGLVLT